MVGLKASPLATHLVGLKGHALVASSVVSSVVSKADLMVDETDQSSVDM